MTCCKLSTSLYIICTATPAYSFELQARHQNIFTFFFIPIAKVAKNFKNAILFLKKIPSLRSE